MFTLRPTQKLARRLGLPKAPGFPVVTNRIADWCVQDFQVGRYRYLLFANTASLLPVVVHARGAVDAATLLAAFVSGFDAAMRGRPGFGQFERWIEPELSQVQFASVPGRSLLGSTNDFIRMAWFHLAEGDSPAQCSQRLARAPMGFLGMNSPERVFPKLGSGT